MWFLHFEVSLCLYYLEVRVGPRHRVAGLLSKTNCSYRSISTRQKITVNTLAFTLDSINVKLMFGQEQSSLTRPGT